MTTRGTGMTSSASSALRHLKTVKPHDGWAVETGAMGVRLLRRSIPINDTWFADLALSQQKCVVGILKASFSNNNKRALVLVEPNGIPARWPRQLLIQTTTAASSTTTTPSPASQTNNNNNNNNRISDEENIQILKYAASGIVAVMVLNVFLSAAYVLYMAMFPVAYFYALQNCPSMESFDAKQQLKRVLRGHDLPENHPDKPKGFIGEALRRVQATVTAELAMSTGYEVYMYNVAGACIIASVRVPSMDADCYWIGAFGKWRFLGQKEIPKTKYD